jgi:3-hydroxyisobutyrate dehydrogenase-like beta-hydroxyacid dehydrogenase
MTHGAQQGGTVAVIGVGRMGAAMATRLRERGAPVVLSNRNRERATALAERIGATVASTAAEAVARATDGSGVAVVSLADDAACRAVYTGADGLLAGLRAPAVVVDTSTIDPRTAAELADLVGDTGAALLDAPVSGSVPAALGGTLTVMVGGPADAVERARPILDLLGRRVFHVGAAGAGATVKLAVNAVVHALNQAVSEAIVLAERAGVPRSAFYDVLAESAAAAPFVGYKRAAFEQPDSAPVAFALDLVAKDLDLILALADRVAAPMAQARTGLETVHRAVTAGLGDRDMSALAEYLRTERSEDRSAP